MDISEAVFKIKSSRKYRHISEEIIREHVQNYLQKEGTENVYEKAALKEIKAKLHKIHGGFRFKTEDFSDLLEKKDFPGILRASRSTRERAGFYGEIYDRIFAITGKPKRILDLGCGLNPVSIDYMALEEEKGAEYFAYDINEQEIKFLNDFFELKGIRGKAKFLDLSKIENFDGLEEDIDICLMFKVIDTLEEFREGHKYAEEAVKKLAEKCKFIVVSFSTKTLSGKRMNHPYRGWIERMLERIGMRFERFQTENEIFYVINVSKV